MLEALWNSFIHGENITDTPAVSLRAITHFAEKNALFLYSSFKEFDACTDVDGRKKKQLMKALAPLKSDELSVQFVSQSIEQNQLALVNEFTGQVAHCASSYCVDKGFNNLFFGQGKNSFILLQQVSCCDAVYFPHEQLLVILGHYTPAKAMKMVLMHFYAYAKRQFKFSQSDFGGILASHGRPYHFYYEVSLAVRSIFVAELLRKVPGYYQFEDDDFLGVDELYRLGTPNKDHLIGVDALNKKSLMNNQYFFQVGLLFNKAKHARLRAGCDAKIMHYVDRILRLGEKETAALTEFKQADIKLWIGVTGQKRAWVEQVEAQAALINRVREHFKHVAVVFDGWTSTMTPSKKHKKEIAADQQVVNKIIKRLLPDIHTLSVVGNNSVQKLAFAKACDFFVANQATGSLHPCRFAKIQGVTHISNAFRENTLQQHYLDTAICFPVEKIRDLPAEGARMDFVSYSIQQDEFVDFVLPLVLACKQPG